LPAQADDRRPRWWAPGRAEATGADAYQMTSAAPALSSTAGGASAATASATGIAAHLDNGGTLENAQVMATHESPSTTKLYDRRADKITFNEVERIVI
jgi:hypothetical protein